MSAISASIHLDRTGAPATIEHVESPNHISICFADGTHWVSLFIRDLAQGRALLDAVTDAVAQLEATTGTEEVAP